MSYLAKYMYGCKYHLLFNLQQIRYFTNKQIAPHRVVIVVVLPTGKVGLGIEARVSAFVDIFVVTRIIFVDENGHRRTNWLFEWEREEARTFDYKQELNRGALVRCRRWMIEYEWWFENTILGYLDRFDARIVFDNTFRYNLLTVDNTRTRRRLACTRILARLTGAESNNRWKCTVVFIATRRCKCTSMMMMMMMEMVGGRK